MWLCGSLIPRPSLALFPGHSQILFCSRFLHSCEIKSGSGLGTRLVVWCIPFFTIFFFPWIMCDEHWQTNIRTFLLALRGYEKETLECVTAMLLTSTCDDSTLVPSPILRGGAWGQGYMWQCWLDPRPLRSVDQSGQVVFAEVRAKFAFLSTLSLHFWNLLRIFLR